MIVFKFVVGTSFSAGDEVNMLSHHLLRKQLCNVIAHGRLAGNVNKANLNLHPSKLAHHVI